MPKHQLLAAAEGMSKFSRRSFLKCAGLASTVASMGAAPVGAWEAHKPTAALSDEQQLEACVEALKAIVGRMHPLVTRIEHGYYPREDGTFQLWFHCEREFLVWSGPGLYRLSEQGCILTFWLERVEERTLSGQVYGHAFVADMYCEDRGEFVGVSRRFWEPRIVEKLQGEGV